MQNVLENFRRNGKAAKNDPEHVTICEQFTGTTADKLYGN